MIARLNDLAPAALRAALTGGTVDWGVHGSAADHVRYAQENPTYRSLCRCGCRKRAKWIGMANGMGLFWGCELAVRRWVKAPAPSHSGTGGNRDE